NSQNITGNVSDALGPVPGVSISAASGATATTDLEGNFSIAAAVDESITFSFIGYATQTVRATATPMQIVLQEGSTALQEVVVIGYGVRRKVDNTGSISQIKGEEITRLKVVNPVQGMQGKAAGVQVIATDSPGGASSLIIRGVGSVNAATD